MEQLERKAETERLAQIDEMQRLEREAAARQRAMITQVQSEVRSLLIDPGSAQFSNFTVFEETGVVCGLVNARNRFGGYDGDKQVVYTPEYGH